MVLERQQQKTSIAVVISCHGLSRSVQIVGRCLFVSTLYNLVFKEADLLSSIQCFEECFFFFLMILF